MTYTTAMNAALDLADRMTDRSKTALIRVALHSNSQPHTMVKSFMILNGRPVPNMGTNLSVSDRLLCLNLIFEEFLEVVEAAGFTFASVSDGISRRWEIRHVEGSQQDHKEMVDGLGDVVFTAFFMSIRLGYDLTPILREITASNFTKLDEDGNPIINGEGKAAMGQPLYRHDQPHGKILKGPNYVKPQLDRLFGHLFPKENV